MAKTAKKTAKKPAAKKPAAKKAAVKKSAKTKSAIVRIGAGKRMSDAVIHEGRVFLAGQVAEKAKGGSVGAQTREILQNIDALLKKAGTDKTRILSANIWLSDIATFAEMNKEWDGWIVAGQTPARATVESKLAGPEYKVEIMLTAAI